MDNKTILSLIIIVVIALSIALFQYRYKTPKHRLNWLFTALRFVTVFSVLLLLLNPKFNATTYFNEKPHLVLAVDNSASISFLEENKNAIKAYQNLISNNEIQQRFNVDVFKFGKEFGTLDSLQFKDKSTNISNVLKRYKELYRDKTAPLVLFTDGNQTLGKDYQYETLSIQDPIFPIVIGDTTKYSDLSISRVNVNRYAYLKNKFPIEIFTNYSGETSVKSILKIISGNSVLFSKQLEFSPKKKTQIVNTAIEANRIGLSKYRIELTPLENEKNRNNNLKNIGVEVIDQKNNIAIVSEIVHPDLGAIKKAIESNEQRSVSILKPKEYQNSTSDFQLVVLYQPNTSFSEVFEKIQKQAKNTFTVTGNSTDWNSLNNLQTLFNQEITNQTEQYQALYNKTFNSFIVDNLSFEDFPPLDSEFGEITFNVPEETILFKTVNGNNLAQPLLSIMEYDGQKHGILHGEGIWKWRAQSYLNLESFMDFDNFMGKLIQFLSSNKKRNRLNTDYKSFYNGDESIIINAQYFNKNYEFDANANLQITIVNKANNSKSTYPFLLKNNSYSIDLTGIDSGDYKFTIENMDEPIKVSGAFTVLEYDVEQQFLNADFERLETLASETEGIPFFANNTDKLVNILINDERFTTIQKSKREIIPLIDYKYLLAIIALALSLEWFLRKYNGLI